MKELTPVISGKQVFLFVAVATTWQHGGGGGGISRPVSPARPPGVRASCSPQQAQDMAARPLAEGLGAAVKAAAPNLGPPQVGYTSGTVDGPCGAGRAGNPELGLCSPRPCWGPGQGTWDPGVGVGVEGEAGHQKNN